MKEGQGRGRSEKEDQNGQKGQTKGKAETSPEVWVGTEATISFHPKSNWPNQKAFPRIGNPCHIT